MRYYELYQPRDESADQYCKRSEEVNSPPVIAADVPAQTVQNLDSRYFYIRRGSAAIPSVHPGGSIEVLFRLEPAEQVFEDPQRLAVLKPDESRGIRKHQVAGPEQTRLSATDDFPIDNA